jgi:hypothetical protein
MAINTADQLQRLVLSANEIRQLTEWPDTVIEDYLNIIENIRILSKTIDSTSTDLKLETIPTQYSDNSVLFVKNGFARQDNPDFTWDNFSKLLNINGTITGKNRAKQFFYAGF